jgi:hypothetical protein
VFPQAGDEFDFHLAGLPAGVDVIEDAVEHVGIQRHIKFRNLDISMRRELLAHLKDSFHTCW